MRDNLAVQLLLLFLPLSFLTIGGGQSAIAEVQREIVGVHGWLSASSFLDLWTLSRMAPGPGSLVVSLIGWRIDGFWGMIAASVGIFLPSSVLVYLVARLWARSRGAMWQRVVEGSLAPVAAGMILASSMGLLRLLQGGLLAWAVAGVSCIVLWFSKISPFILLAAGAIIYGLFYHPVMPIGAG